jgi:two-component system phosphate regulon sensor histidine kinase PhoR
MKKFLSYVFSLKEVLFVFATLIFILYFLFGNNHHFYLSVTVALAVLIFTLMAVYERKKKDIIQLKKIIRKIYLKQLNSSDDIYLTDGLEEIENELKKMYNKNKEDIEYLQKLERIRTEFLGNVSHELRTPIFTIQGYIETLLNGAIDDPNVNKGFLEKANIHTSNLNNLLNDLIDISMIESGAMRMSFRFFNFREFLIPIVNEFIPVAQSKKIQLILHPVKKDLELYGDKIRLKQVMSNLIQNAIKYTDNGKVEIFVEEEEGFGRVIVKDTGIGITEKDLPRIFERFYRVDKARSKEIGGTGLGLAIVKHIIEAHNSKVEVSSNFGEGSQFSFRLKK